MHIIGEYLSEAAENVHFNRKLTVSKEMYERYEIGDAIFYEAYCE